MQSPTQSKQSQEQLIEDLRIVIDNAEELLKNTQHNTGAMYRAARAKLTVALGAATAELARFEEAQLARMIEATHARNLLHGDRTGEERVMRAFH